MAPAPRPTVKARTAQKKRDYRKRDRILIPILPKDCLGQTYAPYKCIVNGVGYEMMAHIHQTKKPGSECSFNYYCSVIIRNTDSFDCILADIRASTIDRRTRQANSRSNMPVWVKEYLQKLKDYQGDMTMHSSDDDEMSDLQKGLQLVYGVRGQPKSHLRVHHKRALRTHRIQFIESFMLRSEWRGKNLAPHALAAYLHVLSTAAGYHGPLLLSPAPILQETEKMEAANKKVSSYGENVQKIKKTYDKVDVETIHTPEEGTDGITLMIRENPEVGAQPDLVGSKLPTNPFKK